jgi:hypothetical protein
MAPDGPTKRVSQTPDPTLDWQRGCTRACWGGVHCRFLVDPAISDERSCRGEVQRRTGRLVLDALGATFAANVRWWPKSVRSPAGRIEIPVVLAFEQIREVEVSRGWWFTTLRFRAVGARPLHDLVLVQTKESPPLRRESRLGECSGMSPEG